MSSPLENMLIPFLQDIVFSAAALFLAYFVLKIGSNPAKTVSIAFICSIVRLVPYAIWMKGFEDMPDLAGASALTGFLAATVMTFFLLKPGAKKSLFAGLAYGLLILLTASVATTLTGLAPGLMQSAQMQREQYIEYESDYMTHGNDSWRKYLLERGLSEERIDAFPFRDGITQGETIRIAPSDKLELGDVIFYKTKEPQTAVMDRIVGVVNVTNWTITSLDGTLGCLKKEEFDESYLQPFKECVENGSECPYDVPDKRSFTMYITKADNLREVDQCQGIFPVIGSQVEGKAIE